MGQENNRIFSIGHSTRSLEQFLEIIEHYGIVLMFDIRTVPRSRKNPQFNRETLPDKLASVQVQYFHMPGLGGLRHARSDSPNTGWRNSSFRGFADYMQTPEFISSLEELIRVSKKGTSAIMCAEAVPWRCHRSLIADALLVRGITVEHILSLTGHRTHKLTPWARVDGLQITYPTAENIKIQNTDVRTNTK